MRKTLYISAFVLGLLVLMIFSVSSFNVNADEIDSLDSADSLEIAEERVIRRIAELILDRCIKCGLCASVCPADAIKMVDHKPVIDPSKCIGCEVCVNRCPTTALKMVDYIEEKDTATVEDVEAIEEEAQH